MSINLSKFVLEFKTSNIFGDLKTTFTGIVIAVIEVLLDLFENHKLSWQTIVAAVSTVVVGSLVKFVRTEIAKQVSTITTTSTTTETNLKGE